eukprot:Gregarina_sp_Pseudo_9__1426@NODE_1954_length_1235_cov_25_182274_g1811_i0_p1_GENE_NODE_1954_length_1235_cov_25_182274_g1811_i0NODE_1954_length_1235_cov_25_182274_g1811_i0_p1_ORF_typecomplete_len360_score64_31ADH_N_2/PF16884_5/3_3e24ADH_zinc_N/PF00107_26/8_1e24ADH_zinc_N_2/PF13602_6/2_6e08PSI_PSAK/PF01241_18/0_0096PSI_PSAK/PF01241_18/4_7e03_NODE_1954_length_1235_cov_25_182274_g1811_i0801159
MTNYEVVLDRYVNGFPNVTDDFKCVATEDFTGWENDEGETNVKLEPSEILLQTEYVSMDPYMRGRMSFRKDSYVPSFELKQPIAGFTVARVLKSGCIGFDKDELVCGIFPWKDRFVFDLESNQAGYGIKRLPSPSPAPPSTFLGALGMPGLTAWLGLHKLCRPKKGETLFVSAASGAVGQLVGQLGKRLGLTVIGSVGSEEKAKLAKEKFGYDEVFNYKTCNNIEEELRKLCPRGIDCYFDNVGGSMLDAVLEVCNRFCRIAACGAISLYNVPASQQYDLKNSTAFVRKSITLEGFIVSNLIQKYGTNEAIADLLEAVSENQLNLVEDIVEGPISEAPAVFIRMLKGENVGKQILKVVH